MLGWHGAHGRGGPGNSPRWLGEEEAEGQRRGLPLLCARSLQREPSLPVDQSDFLLKEGFISESKSAVVQARVPLPGSKT